MTYGLLQLGRISYDCLFKHIQPYNYDPNNSIELLWSKKSKHLDFRSAVNDFGANSTNKEDSEKLKNYLESQDRATPDCTEKLYDGIPLTGITPKNNWNYNAMVC